MCSVLGVARSTYYDFIDRPKSNREKENDELKVKIKKIYDDSSRRYGSPKIAKALNLSGDKVSEKRVQRLMRELNLYSITIKKFRPHNHKKVVEGLENVLNRDFTTTSINEKWVGDITYIHTLKDGWCYLASVLDLHTRKIVGYAFGRKMTDNLVVKALTNAYSTQMPSDSLIFHTDLGSQYTGKEIKKICHELNIIQSFSKKGCPYDNACIESFHAIIKKEEIYTKTFKTFDEANIAIFKYIESWYNRKRMHSAINYMTPDQCEFLARATA